MYMDLDIFLLRVPLEKASIVVLLICILVGGCGSPFFDETVSHEDSILGIDIGGTYFRISR